MDRLNLVCQPRRPPPVLFLKYIEVYVKSCKRSNGEDTEKPKHSTAHIIFKSFLVPSNIIYSIVPLLRRCNTIPGGCIFTVYRKKQLKCALSLCVNWHMLLGGIHGDTELREDTPSVS